MYLINKNSDYAIRAVLEISKNKGKRISSKKISENQKIPLILIRRILGKLTDNDIIDSREGKYGGFKIIKKPDHLNLKSIIEIMQGKIVLNECKYRKKNCPRRSNCVVRRRMKKIEKKLINEFENITFDMLIKDTIRQENQQDLNKYNY